MRLGADHVRVRVPATSANLGPGFDAFGIALGLYDELEVRALGSPGVSVEVTGEGAGQVPDDEQHLVVSSLRAALDLVGASQTGLHLVCHNRIPHGRGLGSSAAAVVAGIIAARGLIAEPEALSDDVAASTSRRHRGSSRQRGAGRARRRDARVEATDRFRRSTSGRLTTSPLAIVPPHHLSTKAARGVLPATVPHADGAFQAGRAALLVEALGRRPELLLTATQDRLHQEYRRSVCRARSRSSTSLRAEGVAAVVSGAGPTVLVLARSQVPTRADRRRRGDARRVRRGHGRLADPAAPGRPARGSTVQQREPTG